MWLPLPGTHKYTHGSSVVFPGMALELGIPIVPIVDSGIPQLVNPPYFTGLTVRVAI